MAEEHKGGWSKLLRWLELVHLGVWIRSLVLSALGWLTAFYGRLDRAWLVGAAIAFFFCLFMVCLNIVIRYRERQRTTLQDARAEVVELKAEAQRQAAASFLVEAYRKLKIATSQGEQKQAARSLRDASVFFYKSLDDHRRDPNHVIRRAYDLIRTILEENQPIENLDNPVREIASQFGLGDLV